MGSEGTHTAWGWTVQQAKLADEGHLTRLIAGAQRVMLRFSADRLGECLSVEPFLLAKNGGEPKGFLACQIRQPPQAILTAGREATALWWELTAGAGLACLKRTGSQTEDVSPRGETCGGVGGVS